MQFSMTGSELALRTQTPPNSNQLHEKQTVPSSYEALQGHISWGGVLIQYLQILKWSKIDTDITQYGVFCVSHFKSTTHLTAQCFCALNRLIPSSLSEFFLSEHFETPAWHQTMNIVWWLWHQINVSGNQPCDVSERRSTVLLQQRTLQRAS